jgi:formylglycine-generating enzyme required for sulfatase activity
MKMAPNYLHRTGYRLPTEPEWEYGCRVGAETDFCFGEPVELLDNYAWFAKNSTGTSHFVGALKPNDLGLFDMHGNVYEWCQDAFEAKEKGGSGKTMVDIEQGRDIDADKNRVTQGGAFDEPAAELLPANSLLQPSVRNFNVGFRPVRTLPTDGSRVPTPAKEAGQQ